MTPASALTWFGIRAPFCLPHAPTRPRSDASAIASPRVEKCGDNLSHTYRGAPAGQKIGL
jgi:hypothetical protein